MPTSRPPSSGASGFTLVEMLVVLTVIGLLAVVATGVRPHKGGSAERARLRASLAQAIDGAKRQAADGGKVASITVVAVKFMPQDVRFQPSIGGDREHILVYPDGSSTGGKLTAIGLRGFSIGWLDGAIHDAP